MFVSWRSHLLSELPNKQFPGNSCRICSFGRFSSILALILFLGFASCGFCDDFSMVSAPLGFEIYGFDKTKNWVSENGVFEFGFFENDVGEFVVGIRYKLGDKAANLPVWNVGGGLRVSINSTFRLSMDGRLVLFENPSGLTVWSSNTSNLGVQKATLLNNGDFVLMGVDDKVLWESFNSPTNTLLPGQSLRYPQNLRAPSKKAISSYYNLVIRRSGELALVWEGNVTYWRSHLGSSVISTVKEVRLNADGVLGLYDDDDANKLIWSITSKDFGDPLISLRHLRIDQDGNLRIYLWDDSVRSWRVGWQAVEDQCNVFGFCGSYSVCGYNSTSPICSCLYSDPGETGSDPGGSLCKKMVDLGNCKMRTSMLAMKQTLLYGLYPPHDFDIMLSEESCKNYCSNDTSCIAVTSKNDGSGLCTVKRTTFISGLATPYVPSTSFLKVCFVPQAVSAHGANPHGNAGSVSLLPGRVESRGGENGKRFIGAIAVIAFVTVSLILTVEVLGFWFMNRRRKIKNLARSPFGKDDKMNPHYSAIIRLSVEEIKELTNNFADQLGLSVFKGLLPNKTPVVAKVINNAAVVTEKEFRVAVSILGGTHHRNLVPLKGFCFDPKQKVLLYEYVPNGSLDNWLFKNEGKNWRKRLDITLGIVRALAYLHTECQNCITHGNLKLENVLLDENLVPKVTDFGIRSLLQKEATSSSSSVSPSEKDIYMLGEMLLQIVLCKRDVVVDSVNRVISEFNQEQECVASDDLDEVERMVRIALWCMQSQQFLRPSIGEVVKVLEGTLSVDKPPSALAIRHEDTMEIKGES